MSIAENKKLIQDAFTAWARGDGTAFFKLLAEDVRWTVIGSTPVSRTYTSREAFVEWMVKNRGEDPRFLLVKGIDSNLPPLCRREVHGQNPAEQGARFGVLGTVGEDEQERGRPGSARELLEIADSLRVDARVVGIRPGRQVDLRR